MFDHWLIVFSVNSISLIRFWLFLDSLQNFRILASIITFFSANFRKFHMKSIKFCWQIFKMFTFFYRISPILELSMKTTFWSLLYCLSLISSLLDFRLISLIFSHFHTFHHSLKFVILILLVECDCYYFLSDPNLKVAVTCWVFLLIDNWKVCSIPGSKPKKGTLVCFLTQ